jgi:copper chaperone NosL
MKLLLKIFAFAFLTLLVVSCKQKTNPDEPPEILYGEDSCDECAMIISEQRYAASYVTEAGDVHRFDDIGGMMLHDQKMQEDVYVYWVHDHNSEEWIKARESILVLNPDLITPMGWGLAAFAERNDAEAYVSEHGGTIANFAEIQELVRSGELDPSKLSSGDHEHEMDSEMDNQDDG